jgi:hypothetical protein
MKQLLGLVLLILVSGCTSVPIQPKFPSVPKDLLASCTELKEIDTTTQKLSEVVRVVSQNYGEYQECKIKVDGWVEWYNSQKKIFESVK